jgi:ABC-type lipoprotein release transport system permease subunit
VQRFAPGSFEVAAFVIGGVIVAILAATLIDTAIIVMSSLLGAALIVSTLGLQPLWSAVAYAALAAVGIVVQMRFAAPGAGRGPDQRGP